MPNHEAHVVRTVVVIAQYLLLRIFTAKVAMINSTAEKFILKQFLYQVARWVCDNIKKNNTVLIF